MNRRTTKQLARQIAHRLQHNHGGVVLLRGPMGAGKTTLVAEIVRILCPSAQPASPTFTVINQYAENLFHADLYRLWENDVPTDPHAVDRILESTGLLDLCVDGNYVLIEWPESFTVEHAIEINIAIKEDGNREFTVVG